MKRLKQWFRGLSTTGKITSIAVASILSFGTIGALAQPGTPPATESSATQTASPSQQSKPTPKVETKTVTSTESIPYTSSTVEDNNLDQGRSETRVVGVNGVRTFTYEITLTDNIETARKEVSNVVTTEPINEVIAKGTKQYQPQVQAQSESSCPNGTYVNTYGNVVCSPYSSNSAPAGASAQCEDGTYSFSQSRRGTCSGHGGVSIWL